MQQTVGRLRVKDKKGKEKDKGWACDLLPKAYIVERYFAAEQQAIHEREALLETAQARLTELEEEHSGEEGAFAELEKINKANVTARIRELKTENGDWVADELAVLKQWQSQNNQITALKKTIKTAEAELDALAYNQYPELSVDEIKALVVDDKWLATLGKAIHGEMDRISQALGQRVRELAERYETPLPVQTKTVADLEQVVNAHLERMGFSWQ